jgi:hypothetical protein
MKKRTATAILITVFTAFVTCASLAMAEPTTANIKGQAVLLQAHACDPTKSLRKKAATTLYKKGSGGDVDITGWTSAEIYPDADANVLFNNITSASIYTGQRNVIVIHKNTDTIKIDQAHRICGQ